MKAAALALLGFPVLLLLPVGACSAGSAPSDLSDAALSDQGTTAKDGNAPCPKARPTDLSACTTEKQSCRYGCGTRADCSGGKWQITETDQACPATKCGPSLECPDPQYCIIASGGPQPACIDNDGGTCAAGTVPCATGSFSGCRASGVSSYSCGATPPSGATCEGQTCTVHVP